MNTPRTSDVEIISDALVKGDVLVLDLIQPKERQLVAGTLGDFVARLRALPQFDDEWINRKVAIVAARIELVIAMLRPKPAEEAGG